MMRRESLETREGTVSAFTLLALMVILPCPGFSGTTNLTGHFTEPDIVETLQVVWTRHTVEISDDMGLRWSEGLTSNIGRPAGICRDLETGLDRIVFITHSGGSNGSAELILVDGDPETLAISRRFTDVTFAIDAPRYFQGNVEYRGGDVFLGDGVLCAAEEYVERRKRGRRIFETLRPPTDSESEELLGYGLPVREISAPVAESLFDLFESWGDGFTVDTVTENEAWIVRKLEFAHLWDSWVVLLLHQKGSAIWRAFFDLAEVDRKIGPMLPKIELEDGNTAVYRPSPVDPAFEYDMAIKLDLTTLAIQDIYQLIWVTDEQHAFLDAMGLALGEYDLIDGGPECEQGQLRLSPVPDSVAVNLGPHPLIWNLGEGKVSIHERGCDFETTATYGPGVAEMLHTSRCADGLENRIEVTITATDVGFDYVRTWSTGSERCSLRLLKRYLVPR